MSKLINSLGEVNKQFQKLENMEELPTKEELVSVFKNKRTLFMIVGVLSIVLSFVSMWLDTIYISNPYSVAWWSSLVVIVFFSRAIMLVRKRENVGREPFITLPLSGILTTLSIIFFSSNPVKFTLIALLVFIVISIVMIFKINK